MKTQFTPGPWIPLLNAFAVCTDNAAPRQANICLLDKKSQNVDEDSMRANARLIAAAPELLAACQAVLTRQDWPVGTCKIKTQVQSAIAKALGQ